MKLTEITIGQRVTWHHEPRGGYGFSVPVPGVVITRGGSLVAILVRKQSGEYVRRWVNPDRLEARTKPAAVLEET
jgi:hypothetical protein